MKKTNLINIMLVIIVLLNGLSGCSKNDENHVVIYTSAEDYRIEYMQQRLNETFPNYDIVIEYMSTGEHAAKLISEGKNTEADITYDLEYGYLEKLASTGVLTDLKNMYDMSMWAEDTLISTFYLPDLKNGGAIIINPKVLSDKGLEVPTSYTDLLKQEYKGLISMPNPKSSGTGYMFLRTLVNTMGEDEAFAYFDELSKNILQYTSSGSGPVNALIQGEVAIGFGMTSQAVTAINEGHDLQILYFEEGSPYSMYGQGIIAGREEKQAVKEVFDFLINVYSYENCEKFFPEQIFSDRIFEIDNYPANIRYSDMSNNTLDEKSRLLDKWKY
ncbi:extracellular solute-binding protein [Holdemania massiliensis]|uniref:extracellular solute-binding protein n=1 Tax=Holdemania massiliensis TaxID=1468449 RepID=UPI003520D088